MKQIRTSLALCVLFIAAAAVSCHKSVPETFDEKVARVHDQVLTVDTHTDTPMRFMDIEFDVSERHETGQRGSGKVDFPRMKDGGLDAIFFAIYLGQGPVTDEGHAAAHEKTLATFRRIHEIVNNNPETVELALTPADARRIETAGKRAIFIGIENGYPVGTELANVSRFYNEGARYITLCHNGNNAICDSSTAKEPEHDGLSPFGEQVVREMNRLGMLIDISHTADSTVEDILAISTAPVFASHSGARAVCDHPRNLPDELIRAVSKKGGVIQVCMVPSFVTTYEMPDEAKAAWTAFRQKWKDYDTLSEELKQQARNEWSELNDQYPRGKATVSDFVNHIDHIVKLAGIDHVGIGSDFDGGGQLTDCTDVSQLAAITAELLRRGYSEEDIRKIWGGNFLRMMEDAIAVSGEDV